VRGHCILTPVPEPPSAAGAKIRAWRDKRGSWAGPQFVAFSSDAVQQRQATSERASTTSKHTGQGGAAAPACSRCQFRPGALLKRRLTDPGQVDILVFGWRGLDAIRSTTSSRVHNSSRWRGRSMAARGARAAAREANHRFPSLWVARNICAHRVGVSAGTTRLWFH
jgi:hypothetical protein